MNETFRRAAENIWAGAMLPGTMATHSKVASNLLGTLASLLGMASATLYNNPAGFLACSIVVAGVAAEAHKAGKDALSAPSLAR